jgi:hypothetical protein
LEPLSSSPTELLQAASLVPRVPAVARTIVLHDVFGTRPSAGETVSANGEPATEPEPDKAAPDTPLLSDAIRGPHPPADTQHSIERQQSDVTSLSKLSAPADVQQFASTSAQRQTLQQLSDSGDADTVVTAFEGVGIAPKPELAEAGSPLGAASSAEPEPGEHTVPEASSTQHQAREATGTAASSMAVPGGDPAVTKASSVLASPAASSAMLSGLGSVGSHASLSALSLDADSLTESELDQLSLGGLDDQEVMSADGALLEGVTDPAADVHVPGGEVERTRDGADDLLGGLSNSEDDFAAGELNIDASLAEVASQLPPAPVALDFGRLPSSGAAQRADQSGPAPGRHAQPALTSEPFSPRLGTDQPDGVVGAAAALPRWEAALAAAEAVEAELLRGELVERWGLHSNCL